MAVMTDEDGAVKSEIQAVKVRFFYFLKLREDCSLGKSLFLNVSSDITLNDHCFVVPLFLLIFLILLQLTNYWCRIGY